LVNLANLLTIGPKKYRDYDNAVTLLEISTEKGDPEAFNMMGICYHEGHGVEKNDKKAYQHYKLAY
jgi:TPR repeat protein